MTGDVSQLLTGSQLALALGRKRQSVQRQLAAVPEDGKVIVKGVPVPGWRVCSLPARMQEQLQAETDRRGYRTIEAYVSAPVKPWEPRIPFAEVSEEDQLRAQNLQKA